MRTIFGSRRAHYLARVSIFLITLALIAGMAGCDPIQYNLTMAVAPGGSGTATDLTNASPYAAGTVVNITTAAAAGYQFVNWTAPAGTFGSATAATTTFTMPGQDVTVTANFAPLPRYNLTMAADPAVGGTATDLTNASPYTAGTVVNITAVAAAGYQFVNWMAPAGTFGSATAATTTFTMPAQNVTVTANFAQSPFYGGSGTAGDPYQIVDWHQLDCARNYLDSYFVLVNNLDSTTAGYDELASPTADGGKGWQPIGSWNALFTGSVDGQGYEIRDLFINRLGEAEVGLFGRVDDGGHIENIGVVNVTVTDGLQFVGGLVGHNDGTVTNSYSTGSVTGGEHCEYIGGLVGLNHGTVTNSYSTGSVTGMWFVGGLVAENRGTVSDSYSAGSVIVWRLAGGLVGNNYGTVSNCYATTSVTGEDRVGGLVGQNVGTVSDSYSTGNVTGNLSVGGLVGYNYYGKGTVSNSYSTGNVTGVRQVGGLVGLNHDGGTVSNSYSMGSVTGNISVGGLVGASSGNVSNSFWDLQTSGQPTSDGGTGKNTTEMQDIATFSGATWNITTVGGIGERNITYIWNIVNSFTYPFLSWQP